MYLIAFSGVVKLAGLFFTNVSINGNASIALPSTTSITTKPILIFLTILYIYQYKIFNQFIYIYK